MLVQDCFSLVLMGLASCACTRPAAARAKRRIVVFIVLNSYPTCRAASSLKFRVPRIIYQLIHVALGKAALARHRFDGVHAGDARAHQQFDRLVEGRIVRFRLHRLGDQNDELAADALARFKGGEDTRRGPRSTSSCSLVSSRATTMSRVVPARTRYRPAIRESGPGAS